MTTKEYLEHAKMMWKNLVPKNGHAATYNGELLRAIENLRDEAQRNGNINWDNRHRFKATFIHETLISSGIFSTETILEINTDIANILNHTIPETSDIVYDRLLHRIVDWDLKNPARLALSNEFIQELAQHDDSAFEAAVQTTEASPLNHAITIQDVKQVQLLLKTGIDIEERDEFDGTPLGGAAAVGNLEIIELLIDAGANINHVDSIGQSVLDMSIYRPEAQQFLKSKGAKSGKQLK